MNHAAPTEETRGKRQGQRVQEERSARRRRRDMGLNRLNVLDVAAELKDPNYTYRWINDTPGRVQQLTQQDDWDVVKESEFNQRSDKEKSVGDNMERVVDKTTGARAILVKKRKDYYEEDKALAQRSLDAIDESIKRGQATSSEGLSGPNAYVPGGASGIVIQDGRKG